MRKPSRVFCQRRHQGQGCRQRRDHGVFVQRRTEGQITKLKLVKRQMYGRAKLDLLQARLIGNHGCTKVASEPKFDPVTAPSSRGGAEGACSIRRASGSNAGPGAWLSCCVNSASLGRNLRPQPLNNTRRRQLVSDALAPASIRRILLATQPSAGDP